MATLTQPAGSTSHNSLAQIARRRPLTSYFVLAYIISWALVLPMTFSQNLGLGLLPYALPDALGLALYILASLVGPTVAALIVAGLSEGRAGVVALLRPIVRWRVGPQWYAVALLANMGIWLVAFGLVLGPELPAAALAHWPLLLSTFLSAVAMGLLIPSIGEEPGWRGFALPRLQARYGPLRATLIVGGLHGLWHLPAMPLLLSSLTPASVGAFLLTAVAGTFLYTWLFNRSGGSVLLAVLMHAASNAASQTFNKLFAESGLPLPETGLAGWLVEEGWLHVLAYGATALLLLALTRGRLGAR